MDQRIISNIPEEYHVAEDIPVTEPERQAFFLERIHTYVEQNRAEGRSLRYAIVTFGCQMNAYDSERMKGLLEQMGYEEAPEEEADLVIFHTCTVRENANQRLYGHLGQLKPLKQQNLNMIIELCACMMQQQSIVAYILKCA